MSTPICMVAGGSFHLTKDSFFCAYQAGTWRAHTVYGTPALLPACISSNHHSLQMHEHLTIKHLNVSLILAWTERECIMYTLTEGGYW